MAKSSSVNPHENVCVSDGGQWTLPQGIRFVILGIVSAHSFRLILCRHAHLRDIRRSHLRWQCSVGRHRDCFSSFHKVPRCQSRKSTTSLSTVTNPQNRLPCYLPAWALSPHYVIRHGMVLEYPNRDLGVSLQPWSRYSNSLSGPRNGLRLRIIS